ncbi:MAG: hypothetical protein ACXWYM_03905 [Candidatus Binatia bacterium]
MLANAQTVVNNLEKVSLAVAQNGKFARIVDKVVHLTEFKD